MNLTHQTLKCFIAAVCKTATHLRITALLSICLFFAGSLKGDQWESFSDWVYDCTPISSASTTRTEVPIWTHPSFYDALRISVNTHIPTKYYPLSANTVSRLKIGNLPEYSSEKQIQAYGGGNEICLEIYGLHKAPDGDWWADRVEIYKATGSAVLEDQNLGPSPFTFTTAAEVNNAAVTLDTTLMCEIRIPYLDYNAPTISVSANSVANTGGLKNMQAARGSSVTFNMSAADSDGNYERTRLWVRTSPNDEWQEIYNSISASGSFVYALGNASTYYFKCRSKDDTEIESIQAMFTIETVVGL